ncbi:hypothetical protein FH972_025469 [Carpinus fangiana]|uniref:Protein MON2 homolog n=1 Tax=Carpinus fangiana TaxID=176857 RepID=A0A5N6L253_9ROSI|nr:hypothetical protein FH972_025469 [Carpinus fangiana]
MSCYYPDGSVAWNHTACNRGAANSHCCAWTDACLTNGYCLAASGNMTNTLLRESCTDPTWRDPACPRYCSDRNLNGSLIMKIVDAHHGVEPGTWCCGTFNQDKNTCSTITLNQAEPWTLPNGRLIYDRNTGAIEPINVTSLKPCANADCPSQLDTSSTNAISSAQPDISNSSTSSSTRSDISNSSTSHSTQSETANSNASSPSRLSITNSATSPQTQTILPSSNESCPAFPIMDQATCTSHNVAIGAGIGVPLCLLLVILGISFFLTLRDRKRLQQRLDIVDAQTISFPYPKDFTRQDQIQDPKRSEMSTASERYSGTTPEQGSPKRSSHGRLWGCIRLQQPVVQVNVLPSGGCGSFLCCAIVRKVGVISIERSAYLAVAGVDAWKIDLRYELDVWRYRGIVGSAVDLQAVDAVLAADKALQELRGLPSTSEAQLAAACKSKNAKIALPAVNALQRLTVLGALTEETLPDVLEAFQESTSFGLDVQLKILQSVPSLLQNYSTWIQGRLQATILQICSTLQQTKTAAISRTASATLQQAVSFLFEKLESEAEDEKTEDEAVLVDLKLGDEVVKVTPTAEDAYRTLRDICLLVEGENPQFVLKASLSPTFGLEILEAILTDHSHIFTARHEQQHVLRNRVMPLITRLLSEKLSFSITVRTTRILCIMLREHLDIVKEECEIPLSLLNHSLDTDAGTPWRRALCMEAMRLLFSNSTLLLEIYTLFDENTERRSVIQETLASFVRLAAEKPNLIGIGQQSSYPASQSASSKAQQEQAAVVAAADAGIIGGDFGVSEVNVPGISAQWSVMRIPCLDLLDKNDPPSIPETYIYSLVLTCVNNLTDALAKVALPLTVPDRGPASKVRREAMQEDPESPENDGVSRKRSNSSATKYRTKPIPANPLDLVDHPSHESVKATVALITNCWPAILATSSTFLYAALDADYYRSLIRSFQKVTQVAGLLRLSTPRDAFLTTLAKAAIPAGIVKNDPSSATPMSAFGGSPRVGSSSGRFQNTDSYFNTPESPNMSRRGSLDSGGPSLSQRNLMCLRALVNLAIALGPVLDQAWSIVLDSVQKASVLLAHSGTMAMARDYRSGSNLSDSNGNATAPQTTLSSEISAVESAVSRLIQSTGEYPNNAFKNLLTAICSLISDAPEGNQDTPSLEVPSTPGQRRVPSISGIVTHITSNPQYDHFAIAKLGEVARVNLMRLTYDTDEGGWNHLLTRLLAVSASPHRDITSRLMAADVIGSLTVESAATTVADAPAVRATTQKRSIESLQILIRPLRSQETNDDSATNNTSIDIHKTALDALGAILERCGEAVATGWELILEIILSAFRSALNEGDEPTYEEAAELVSARLARSAFGSVQLISSDFLSSVPANCFPTLIDIASRFCAQQVDLNLSLTAITICWNVTDHVQSIALRKGGSAHTAQALDLWLETQRRLLPITTDSRADVRNGVVHTLFRVLDSAGDHIGPPTWATCMRDILFRLIAQNVQIHQSLLNQAEEIQNSQTKPWTATSKVIIEGTSRLCSSYLDTINKVDNFPKLWQEMLDHLASYLALSSYEISTDVFSSLSSIVENAEEQRTLNDGAIDRLGNLWMSNAPVQKMRGEAREGEKTMAAYVALQKQLLKLLQPRLTSKHIQLIAESLDQCLAAASPAPYTSDVDSLTALQRETLDSMRLLRADVPESPSIIIQAMSRFVILPYARSATTHTSAHLTFVAFAKGSIEQLEEVTNKSLEITNSLAADALHAALLALSETIQRKYTWTRQGREPSLWRTGTTAGVSIVQHICSSPNLSQIETTHTELWANVVDISSAIMRADVTKYPDNDQLLKDESFDLEAAATLLRLVTPHLGAQPTSAAARLKHVQALFHTSLLHPVGSDELPLPLIDPLNGLYSIRLGRTVDPSFNPRVRMCYFCFDQLLSLVASASGAEQNTPGIASALGEQGIGIRVWGRTTESGVKKSVRGHVGLARVGEARRQQRGERRDAQRQRLGEVGADEWGAAQGGGAGGEEGEDVVEMCRGVGGGEEGFEDHMAELGGEGFEEGGEAVFEGGEGGGAGGDAALLLAGGVRMMRLVVDVGV